MKYPKITIGRQHFVLSNEIPKQGDCYLTIVTDSTGPRLITGTRLETNETKDSHKNCIKIIATNHKGLNREGCPTLKGFIL